jgi:hypothetical protein
MRLEKGDVSIYDLSMNMGCKVKQIENHYSHLGAVDVHLNSISVAAIEMKAIKL